jgi:hypothetical protein
MKITLLTTLVLAFSLSSFSQSKDFDEVLPNASELDIQDHHRNFVDGLAGVQVGGKWGVINEQGEFVIEAKYEFINLFKDEVACFYENNLAGYINKKGEVVIKPQFKQAKDFSEGMAAFLDEKSNLWGFIDLTGEIVIKPKYTMVRNFSEGTALVNIGGECYYEFCSQWGGGLVGVIDKTGKEIVPIEYKIGYSSTDGLIILQKIDGVDPEYSSKNITFYKKGKTGAINSKGEVIIPFEYAWINPPCNGTLAATKMDGDILLKGIIDVNQNIIVPFQECNYYYNCGNLETHSVPNNGHYFIIIHENTRGLYKDSKLILEAKYKDFCYINDDAFMVTKDTPEGTDYAIIHSDLSPIHDFGSFQTDWGKYKLYGADRYLIFKNDDRLYLKSIK